MGPSSIRDLLLNKLDQLIICQWLKTDVDAVYFPLPERTSRTTTFKQMINRNNRKKPTGQKPEQNTLEKLIISQAG